jgi:hypothetical protein
VLQQFLRTTANEGVASASTLASYVANQRPLASDTWIDAMMLAMAGKVVDNEYIGDYPHNVRFYAALTPADWALIRTGEPFSAAALSSRVRPLIRKVLLQSRNRMQDRDEPDPAYWPSIEPRALVIQAELIEEPVLLAFTGYGASVQTLESAGANYDLRKRELKREPTYQPAQRRKLKLTINSVSEHQRVTTGFSEVFPDPLHKPTPWKQLPGTMPKQFEEASLRFKKFQTIPGQAPPPLVN